MRKAYVFRSYLENTEIYELSITEVSTLNDAFKDSYIVAPQI
jgi:hypothetical protein